MTHLDLRTGESPFEVAEIDDVKFLRDANGVWRYAESGIPVPGARDVTLTERFQPKLIINSEQEIERVVVSAGAIATVPELLGWCLTEGTPVKAGDELLEVLVPYELWQKRDRIPGELIVPEYHGSEAQQQVAAAEREYREVERQFEKAADYRAEVLRRHYDEMTRQEARAITGLSVGRIQQLIRAGGLEPRERQILELFADGPISSYEGFQKKARLAGLSFHDDDAMDQVVKELEHRDFLEWSPDGIGLTEEGAQILSGVVSEAQED
jgi:hypothetical protein